MRNAPSGIDVPIYMSIGKHRLHRVGHVRSMSEVPHLLRSIADAIDADITDQENRA